MGCLKLPYYEKEDALNFLGVWKKSDGSEKSSNYYPYGLPMDGREITTEDYRWGYQGQYSEKDSVTGWNQFQLRMYDARFGRWMSVDPYGQFASPYLGMGNNPQFGVDPDGGWNLWTGLAGFGVGAGLAVLTGHEDDWWKWGLAGGLIGAASFETKNISVRGSQTSFIGYRKTIVLSDFGHNLLLNFNYVNRNFGADFNRLYRRPIKKWIKKNKPDDPNDIMNKIYGKNGHPDLEGRDGKKMKPNSAIVRYEIDGQQGDALVNHNDELNPVDPNKNQYTNPGKVKSRRPANYAKPKTYRGRPIEVTIKPKNKPHMYPVDYINYKISIHFQMAP